MKHVPHTRGDEPQALARLLQPEDVAEQAEVVADVVPAGGRISLTGWGRG